MFALQKVCKMAKVCTSEVRLLDYIQVTDLRKAMV
jgi:hypothetical protein